MMNLARILKREKGLGLSPLFLFLEVDCKLENQGVPHTKLPSSFSFVENDPNKMTV
jgi:hypothetical protein